MLEKIIKRSRGIVLGFIVFALSLVFVVQFGGPQSQGCSPSGPAFAARVYGEQLSKNEFDAAYMLAGGDRYPSQMAKQSRLKELVLYGLVERHLLARAARDLGFDVTEDEVMQRLAEDGTLYLSLASSAPAYMPSGARRFDFTDSQGAFDPKNLRNFIQYRLGRSIREFTRSQIDETLAQRMRELVTGAVTVSDAEVWDAFVREQEKANLAYVRFSPVYYRDRLQVSDAELTAWMEENVVRVGEAYERQKHRYTGLDKQVRARHILVKADAEAADDVKAKARAKAQKLLARARAGEDFAKLASEHSEDTGSARKGGDLGYNPRGRMVEAFDEAQFALAAGQVSDLVETRYGFHIIRVEAVREGDVPEAEAKRELADGMYRDERAAALAKEGAERALAALGEGSDSEALKAQLPTGGADDALAPSLQETEAFGRSDTPIPGPFDSSPLVRSAFELTEESPLPAEPLRLGDDYFAYRLQERSYATREGLDDETRQRLYARLMNDKQHEALRVYVQRLLNQAAGDGAVAVNDSLLTYDDAS